jgi:predicted transcriptional regulator
MDKKNDQENQAVGEFMDLFEDWERYLRVRFKSDSMYRNTREFWEHEQARCQEIGISESDLLGLFNLRNVSVHASSFVDINKPAIVKLQRIVNTFSKKAVDIATRKENIFKVNLKESIGNIVKTMDDKDFSHVPVVKENEFIGVFSEHTLLSLVAQGVYDPDKKIGEIKDLLVEAGEDYVFLPLNVDFYRIYQMFQEHIAYPERLKAIFLTESGKPSSEIKGMITAWDLHKGKK